MLIRLIQIYIQWKFKATILLTLNIYFNNIYIMNIIYIMLAFLYHFLIIVLNIGHVFGSDVIT